MLALVLPARSRLPRVRFFNLGGGPTLVGGELGFTEGGLVHAVQSMAPLTSRYEVDVVCPNVADAKDVVNEVSFRGVRITCPRPSSSVRWMHAGELSAAERPLRTILNWPSIVAGYVSQSRQLAHWDGDVVLANGILGSYLVGLTRGRWLKIAVLHHLYHDPWTTGAASSSSGFHARAERFLLNSLQSDAIAVVNPSVASRLAQYGYPPERVTFVGNGVDQRAYPFSRHHDEDTLVYVGRLRAAKGVASVLDAFSLVHRERPRAVLHIIGDGLLRESLQVRAASLGVANSVVFHGFVDEETKTRLMRSAAVYLSASRFEGFGLPVAEAMSVGAVPVVSDIPAHRYIFQDRHVGFLTANADEMADRVLELLRHPALRASMSFAGRALVEEMWTWEHVAARYGALIDGLLAARTGGGV
jgi:glycosyltransferase involved in cell wall biosynthesis